MANVVETQKIKGTIASNQSVTGAMKSIPALDETLSKKNYAAEASAVGSALKEKAPLSHTTDYSNPHKVTAEQAGARPNTWLPTIAEIGAAPSGYGLGLGTGALPQYSSPAQVDALTKAGWYEYYSSTESCCGYLGTYYGGILVIPSMWEVTQLFFCRDYYGGYLKRTIGQPWEWVNPPMIEGAEYRTTERYDGKPVYAKRIYQYYSSIGGSGIVDTKIPHGITGFGVLVRHDSNLSSYPLPILWSSTQNVSVFYVDATNITLRIVNDTWSSCRLLFTLYYTKTE